MDILTIQTPLGKFGIGDKFGKFTIDSISKSEQEVNCFHLNGYISEKTTDTIGVIYSQEVVVAYNTSK